MLVDRARCLLLDFDGPVCRVFAGHPASTVADDLCRVLVDHGVTAPEAESDPLEVLRYSATLNKPHLTRLVEDALRAAEMVAVHSAEPTPYTKDVIMADRRIVIVSNNSADAIHAYLAAQHLTVDHVIGRPYAEPARMKPNPWPVLAALSELGVQPEECVMVGDSITDIEAARAAGVPVIGYANKPGKRARLATADLVIDSMADLMP